MTAIEAACGSHVFRATHQSMKFSGFTAIYEAGRDDEQEKLDSPLPDLAPGEALTASGFDKQQHFTQPPARYTEASLVRAMEEKGVGRPSTYAAIIATIQDREYVIKTDKKLSPTKLGRGGQRADDGPLPQYHQRRIHRRHGKATRPGRGPDSAAGRACWRSSTPASIRKWSMRRRR